MNPTIYVTIAHQAPHARPPQYGAVALSEDGEILAGAVDIDPDALPAKMGLGSHQYAKHEFYIARYPDGFELVWVTDPANHGGFQKAQQKLLAANPDYKYDPRNPQPFKKDNPSYRAPEPSAEDLSGSETVKL